MKKFIKSTLLVIGATFATLLFTNLFLDAWDNTMTDEEIVYYLEKYPTEEKLIKLAERRNLIEKVEWSHFSKKNLENFGRNLENCQKFLIKGKYQSSLLLFFYTLAKILKNAKMYDNFFLTISRLFATTIYMELFYEKRKNRIERKK